MSEAVPNPSMPGPPARLLEILGRLDRLLSEAVRRAGATYGENAATDAFRGLYLAPDDVDRLLRRPPLVPFLHGDADAPGEQASIDTVLTWLEQTFVLSSLDLNVIVLALAPELDLRYERIYAYLQDDVTRRRPSVELALNLLTGSVEEKLDRLNAFASDAPLLAHGLILRLPPHDGALRSSLADGLTLDPQLLQLFLGEDGLDGSLTGIAHLIDPDRSLAALPLWPDDIVALLTLARRSRLVNEPLRLVFSGVPDSGRRATAEALATELGMRLLVVDDVPTLLTPPESRGLITRLLLAAHCLDAILYVPELAATAMETVPHATDVLFDALACFSGIAIVAGAGMPARWRDMGPAARSFTVTFSLPDAKGRVLCWRQSLKRAGIAPPNDDIALLAGRFRLGPEQIEAAVATAVSSSLWRSASTGDAWPELTTLSRSDLVGSARHHSGHDLQALAVKMDPVYTWDDIVLPHDARDQLREICLRVMYQERVLFDWGFARTLSLGRGISALFSGPSGTGKTMAAEVVASELQLDLYRIDLSGVVSKYIGETEKNLDRIFRAAESANAILFFDEADALFGKRSTVRDSHDRYANIETSYLLQKMEQFEGVAILATNLRGNLDESFTRRLTFVVHFPFPDAAARREIWSRVWSPSAPLSSAACLDYLCDEFELSGGNIKNIALAAAFLAAAEGEPITMRHLLRATRREYGKMGKALTDDALLARYETASART